MLVYRIAEANSEFASAGLIKHCEWRCTRGTAEQVTQIIAHELVTIGMGFMSWVSRVPGMTLSTLFEVPLVQDEAMPPGLLTLSNPHTRVVKPITINTDEYIMPKEDPGADT